MPLAHLKDPRAALRRRFSAAAWRLMWRSLVRETAVWRRQIEIELAHADNRPWVFELDGVDIGEFRFVALRTPRDLWGVGRGLGQCLYSLRHLCERSQPSRFFIIRCGGVDVGAAERQPGSAIEVTATGDPAQEPLNQLPSATRISLEWRFLPVDSREVPLKRIAVLILSGLLTACFGSDGGNHENAVPVANSGADQAVMTNAVVTLDGSASSDADGDPLTYGWTLVSRPAGSAAVLSSPTVARPTFTVDAAGTYTASLVVNDGKVSSIASTVRVTASIAPPIPPSPFTLAQSISDEAQGTTIAFSGLALLTGNLDAQSFFPPGKVADYTGFQYLRDNDPDRMGHNTSFLTRVANNVIYLLNSGQLAQLSALAARQQGDVDLYGYKRYPLMQAFRRLIDGNLPAGATGLNLNAVRMASRELYLIDGQISFDRAVLYANIINSLDTTQKAYLAAMKGKGWSSWPDITDAQLASKLAGLPQGSKVAVMTYASDIYSWYAGSLEADIYFCPERHGTYYGGFYIKDAPAVGHEGYSIDEQITATAGAALIEPARGYVTQAQAGLLRNLVNTQRDNLNSIVSTRTQIATLLRTLLSPSTSPESVRSQVLTLSGTYGDLDGASNYLYATAFSELYKTLGADQKIRLAALRRSLLSGTYADGTAFDFSVATTPFLYSAALTDAQIAPYVSDTVTNRLFVEP